MMSGLWFKKQNDHKLFRMKIGEGAVLKKNLIARTPLGRITEIHEVVNSILFLLSKTAAPMISGEHLFIDGGYRAF